MASLPYQRNSDSTRSSASSYFPGSSTPPRPSSPVWKSQKKARVDKKRLTSLLAIIVGVVLLIVFLSSLSTRSKRAGAYQGRDAKRNKNHFEEFEGGHDCRVSSSELYVPPVHSNPSSRRAFPYCKDRKSLLEALNSGGRHGFDEPFTPKGCHYKWYSPFEVCMILDRFDGVVFTGDDLVQNIYGAFNMLLRKDLSLGSLQGWKMNEREREACRCDNQLVRSECRKYIMNAYNNIEEAGDDPFSSGYACNRIPHFYYRSTGFPTPQAHLDAFKEFLDQDLHSWKPVATIQSLGLSTELNFDAATNSMDEWLTIADNSGRNTPFLWLNPNAAGHLKSPNKAASEGNSALWHYTVELGKESIFRGIEHLDMYNLTLQAASFDGTSYGQRVALVQAMEIINWLARLETT